MKIEYNERHGSDWTGFVGYKHYMNSGVRFTLRDSNTVEAYSALGVTVLKRGHLRGKHWEKEANELFSAYDKSGKK